MASNRRTTIRKEWKLLLSESLAEVSIAPDMSDSPPTMKWINEMVLHPDIPAFDSNFTIGCSCTESCSPPNCQCPSDENYYDNGKVKELIPTPVYECNFKCSCPPNCGNRVSQLIPDIEFSIFQTEAAGFSVKSLTDIPVGSFITNYLGELISLAEFTNRSTSGKNMEYIFEIGVSKNNTCEYMVDCFEMGNISRFFNHSCDPNMAVYAVYIDTPDPTRHNLGFYAIKPITFGEEITFDYRGTAGSKASLGFQCRCGSRNCVSKRKRKRR